MNRLEEKFNAAIKDKFNILEWKGFQTKPELSLMVGMAIGYKIGVEETEEIYNNLIMGKVGKEG